MILATVFECFCSTLQFDLNAVCALLKSRLDPRVLRIWQIQDPNAVYPVPALLKCDLMCPVSGATLNVDLPSPDKNPYPVLARFVGK